MKHLFLLLFFFCNFLVSGLEQSTIVWTDAGKAPIASIVVITFENDDTPIICSRFQQFLTIDNEWKPAIELSVGDCLQAAEPVFISSIKRINEPIILYDLCVVPNHTFCVGDKKIIAHNFVPFIGITISLLFGAGTALEWSIITGFAAGFGLFGFAMNKNHKKKKMVVKPVVSVAVSSPGNPNDDDENEKERQFNEMSKTEFFKKVKEDYRFNKQTNAYQRIKGKKGLRCLVQERKLNI